MEGGEALAQGFLRGVTGLVQRPLQGAAQAGVGGAPPSTCALLSRGVSYVVWIASNRPLPLPSASAQIQACFVLKTCTTNPLQQLIQVLYLRLGLVISQGL